MTMSVSPNVPRWMRENRRSRESYVQSYGYAAVNPATQAPKSEASKPDRQAVRKSIQTGRTVKRSST